MTTPKVATVSIGGDRWYVDPVTGDKVPGVSSIKDTLGKPGLLYGAVKVAATFAVDNVDTVKALADTDRGAAIDLIKRAHTRAWSGKADSGTGVHAIVEDLMRKQMPSPQLTGGKAAASGPIKVSPDQRKYVVAYARFVKRYKVKPLYLETTVWSEKHRYAGTFDAIYEMEITVDEAQRMGIIKAGVPWDAPRRITAIVDTKTGASGVWPEVALQQVAYKNADYMILANGERVPMPFIDATFALWLRPEGYALIPLDSGEATWKAFLGLRDAYDWSKRTDAVYPALNEDAIKKRWRPS